MKNQPSKLFSRPLYHVLALLPAPHSPATGARTWPSLALRWTCGAALSLVAPLYSTPAILRTTACHCRVSGATSSAVSQDTSLLLYSLDVPSDTFACPSFLSQAVHSPTTTRMPPTHALTQATRSSHVQAAQTSARRLAASAKRAALPNSWLPPLAAVGCLQSCSSRLVQVSTESCYCGVQPCSTCLSN